MANKNELIFINKILTGEFTIRKTAKSFGLRRDDLIRRIREALEGDEESLKQLDLIITINKMLFDDMPVKEACEILNLDSQELDKQILKTLSENPNKMKQYLDYKDRMKNKGKKTKKNSKQVGKGAKK